MKYYVLVIQLGVEAEVRGPFATPDKRDREARMAVRLDDFNGDYDSIFRMDIEHDRPETYSFADGELYDEEPVTV